MHNRNGMRAPALSAAAHRCFTIRADLKRAREAPRPPLELHRRRIGPNHRTSCAADESGPPLPPALHRRREKPTSTDRAAPPTRKAHLHRTSCAADEKGPPPPTELRRRQEWPTSTDRAAPPTRASSQTICKICVCVDVLNEHIEVMLHGEDAFMKNMIKHPVQVIASFLSSY
ncbi:unnamed protein product [Urochloa humidicola]